MKTILFYFTCLWALGCSTMSFAQTSSHFIICDSLVVTTINADSISSGTLQIEIANNSTQDIEYPWIGYVLNPQGDTVATGISSSILQFANSSQNYTVTRNSNFSPYEPFYTVVFLYKNPFGFGRIGCSLNCSFPINGSNFCDSLTVMSVNPDSAGNLTISVRNNSSQFISYPFIDFVLNAQGDTIAHGNTNFFGQQSYSTQNYTAQIDSGYSFTNTTYTIFFRYMSFFEYVCPLSYSTNYYCDSLQVMGMSFDSIWAGKLKVEIANNNPLFLYDTYIDFILDAQGDTVANGFQDNSYQGSDSVKTYMVNSTLFFPVHNSTYTIFFKYTEFFWGIPATLYIPHTCPLSFLLSLTTTLNTPTNKSISVYPNPVSENRVTINCGDVLAKKVVLYNIVGQNVFELNSVNQSQFTMDVSSLNKGGYFMELTDINNKIVRQKLIVE